MGYLLLKQLHKEACQGCNARACSLGVGHRHPRLHRSPSSNTNHRPCATVLFYQSDTCVQNVSWLGLRQICLSQRAMGKQIACPSVRVSVGYFEKLMKLLVTCFPSDCRARSPDQQVLRLFAEGALLSAIILVNMAFPPGFFLCFLLLSGGLPGCPFFWCLVAL